MIRQKDDIRNKGEYNGSCAETEKKMRFGLWLKTGGTLDTTINEGDTIVVPINQNYHNPMIRYRELSTVVILGIVSLATLLAL